MHHSACSFRSAFIDLLTSDGESLPLERHRNGAHQDPAGCFSGAMVLLSVTLNMRVWAFQILPMCMGKASRAGAIVQGMSDL